MCVLCKDKTGAFLHHCEASDTGEARHHCFMKEERKSTYIIFCSLLPLHGAFLASGRFTVCLNTSGIGDMKKQYQPQDLNNCHTDHHLLPGEKERGEIPSSHRTS